MIQNPSFRDAGKLPGQAAGWTLRSVCVAEQIAGFGPPPLTSVELFDRWSSWTASLGSTVVAPFRPRGTIDDFDDGWPTALFMIELSPGGVAATSCDSFDDWLAEAHFAWPDVPQVLGVFTGNLRLEAFAAWRPGDPYTLALPESALARASFHGVDREFFDAAVWPTKNPAL
jgi:hypothetical protein